ncbi:hypothetical protein [Microbacterium karelineae]|uniref:hypothetical protein n=1 Tax=Microbacterium karelineae TaxID=2654283 RepID=UPI0012EB0033|nr:hypothetical protein [Microbacterium karelineae]
MSEMTHAEMRGKAHALRSAIDKAPPPADDLWLRAFVENVRAGADALERTAGALTDVDQDLVEVAILDPDTAWSSVEVVEILEHVRSLLLTGGPTPGSFGTGRDATGGASVDLIRQAHERAAMPRLGKSMAREMDRDIVMIRRLARALEAAERWRVTWQEAAEENERHADQMRAERDAAETRAGEAERALADATEWMRRCDLETRTHGTECDCFGPRKPVETTDHEIGGASRTCSEKS